MSDYKTILFDLDGTLVDSRLGVTRSIRRTLEKMGRQVPATEVLERFIGPPLIETYVRDFAMSPQECETALAHHREYYGETGYRESTVFPGIPELLRRLKDDGRKLAVATSKPTVFARQMLDHWGLSDCFEHIEGSGLDNSGAKKSDVIQRVFDKLDLRAASDIVMIGDREHDIIGAKTAGIDSIGILYGFGDRDELAANGADRIAETVEDLGELLIGA